MRISDWSSDVCSSDLAYAPQVAELVGSGRVVLEFGSGSSIKTPLLLRELAASAYVPLDISGEFLRQASIELAAKFPELPIIPIEANFMRPVRLPRSLPDRASTEEHTYELQSLMRISNAVFFLKTTTKT